VEQSQQGTVAVDEADLRLYLDKWDRKYWATYKVLDILQKVGWCRLSLSNPRWKRLDPCFNRNLMDCLQTLPSNSTCAALSRCFTAPTPRARRSWRCAPTSTCRR